MKLRYRTLFIALCIGFIGLTTLPAHAQVGDVGRILQASADDAELLVENYLKPFGSGFGAGLNSGWTNAAQPHKTLGFDVTVSTALAIVPDSDKSFDFTELNTDAVDLARVDQNGNIVPATSSEVDPITQTISGKDQPGPLLGAFEDIDGDGNPENLFNFEMPGGTDFGYVPAPEIKAGVGIIKDTELMLRYVPKINIKDYGSFQQYGFGAKHGINQWIPGGNVLPVNISVMVGYTNQTLSKGFRFTGEDAIGDRNNVENPYSNQPETWDGQKAEISTEAYTVSALVGKSLPILSFYAGVGYEASTMSIGTPGTYPTVGENPDFDPQNPGAEDPLIVQTLDEPINLELEGGNKFHGLAGLRLRFGFFHISASYKQADYSTVSAAVGISFR